MNLISRLIKEESGQGMVEYGLILALVSVVAILALTSVGTQVKAIFTDLTGRLTVTPTP